MIGVLIDEVDRLWSVGPDKFKVCVKHGVTHLEEECPG
jgi:hypothetical protein